MAAIIDVEQCAGLRGKAAILYATDHPGEGIPGSLAVDLSEPVADPRDRFEALGISDATPVVAYGELAPCVWWLARVAGLRNVAVLDGGLHAWEASGRATGALGEPGGRGTITAEIAEEFIAEEEESNGYVTTLRVDEALHAALVDERGYFSSSARRVLEERAGGARALIFSRGERACAGALAATVAGYGDVRVIP
ncbi:sulfurtransferase [Corynebacterium mastitidis]|uniref:Rhodanese-like domain-containing protein n=1 Tax=Corynebacterium mastitidis TaxID=161890 RepID=A0A2N0XAU0_9CORY|nr:rhodanese-like domain-containing protein [Corynebacterium mastitidis]MCH6196158.1 sulfurtransferase [Corynebacterium mastitidis]PKF69787.1 rhodanese-like domain-containing protein [Corynebacterium mastitidis]